jgi:hypothetical protein
MIGQATQQMIHDTPADTRQPSPAEQLQKPVTTLLRPLLTIDEQNVDEMTDAQHEARV